MAVATQATGTSYLQRAPRPSGLADVVDLILDKGLVIDAYVRIAVIGIELITIDARIVIASVDTYLRFAEAVNRLELSTTQVAGLPELIEEAPKKLAEGKVEGAIEGAKEKIVPESSTARTAAKGVAAAAALGAATVAARELASRFGSNGSGSTDSDDTEE